MYLVYEETPFGLFAIGTVRCDDPGRTSPKTPLNTSTSLSMSEHHTHPPASSERKQIIDSISGSVSFKKEQILQGIGDDAAVVQPTANKLVLLGSETHVEGVEFDLAFMPFHQVGARIVSAAVSDVYAMNGSPSALLINLAVPNRIKTPMIEELYRGISMACHDYECQLAGGDLTGSHNALVLTATVYGEVSSDQIVYNKGATQADAICVTGDLGSALAGLKVLLREKKHWEESGDSSMQPDLTAYDYIVKRQLVPVARKELPSVFQQAEVKPSAMIDVSKGLLHDVQRLLSASSVGAYLYQAALPVDPQTRMLANEMQEDVDRYVLYGGEDYELLFTMSESDVEKLARVYREFTVIGKVTKDTGKVEIQSAEGDIHVYQ